MAQRSIASMAEKALNISWEKIKGNLRRLDQRIPLRPKSGVIVLKESTKNSANFKFGPIVLLLPEKPSKNRETKVFVVIEGDLTLEQVAGSGILRTQSYQTHIGYFREKEDCLNHVFGAHYDFDTNFAHPVFHVQISTQASFETTISQNFSYVQELKKCEDKVRGLLGNVRVPTAQMDFFAVLLQVVSDHLINETTPENVQELFKDLCENCRPFASYGLKHDGLKNSIKDKCLRSSYWYEH